MPSRSSSSMAARSWPRRPEIPPCCSSTTARASGWALPMGIRCIITSTTCRGVSSPTCGPLRARWSPGTATMPGASAQSPTPAATPLGKRIPSAIGATTMIPKQGCITSTAGTIARSLGGLLARTGS